jgi:hypothetical protein
MLICYSEKLKGRDNLAQTGVDGRIVLKYMYIKETQCEKLDWMQLDQDRSQWRALVITVISLFLLRGIFNDAVSISD